MSASSLQCDSLYMVSEEPVRLESLCPNHNRSCALVSFDYSTARNCVYQLSVSSQLTLPFDLKSLVILVLMGGGGVGDDFLQFLLLLPVFDACLIKGRQPLSSFLPQQL